MASAPPEPSADNLQQLDRVARAAHSWVRQQVMERRFHGEVLCERTRYALAGGFIRGLGQFLALDEQDIMMLAYVYSLMAEEGREPMSAVWLLLQAESDATHRHRYREGLKAARDVLAESLITDAILMSAAFEPIAKDQM